MIKKLSEKKIKKSFLYVIIPRRKYILNKILYRLKMLYILNRKKDLYLFQKKVG